ncbi:MAG: hypothetical protein H6842_16065 [Rhodospirillaceae bacterium]|nr:hypothetical protein [Rhodospirillaceae bacterium]
MQRLPEGQEVAAVSAPAATQVNEGGQDIRLKVRLEESINRIVFEYRERETDQLVRQLPAREVIRFYQMMEARAEAAAEPDTQSDEPTTDTDGESTVSFSPSSGGGGGEHSFDSLDSDIPQFSPAPSAILGGGRGFETAGVVNAYA